MALLPYLLDEFRPRRNRDQLFHLDLSPDDFLVDVLPRPVVRRRQRLHPWSIASHDVGTTIKADKDKFQVNVDVQHFDPEEISVKTVDGYIVIEGNHEERKDDHGFVSRRFKRRYALPEGCNPDTVESKLSSDGVLTVTAPKSCGGRDERAVTITQTGPVRRKMIEEENGEVEDARETNSPEKKVKRKR